MPKRYGPAGKLVFFHAEEDPLFPESHYKIVDRPGTKEDVILHNQEVIAILREGRWVDLLMEYDGEVWSFKDRKGTPVVLSQRQYQAKKRLQ